MKKEKLVITVPAIKIDLIQATIGVFIPVLIGFLAHSWFWYMVALLVMYFYTEIIYTKLQKDITKSVTAHYLVYQLTGLVVIGMGWFVSTLI